MLVERSETSMRCAASRTSTLDRIAGTQPQVVQFDA